MATFARAGMTVLLAVSFLLAGHGADAVCSWVSGTLESSVDGAVRIVCDGNDRVTAIEVTPVDGDTVSLSGDDIPLAPAAQVVMKAPGKFVLESALTGTGTLSVTNAILDWCIEYAGTRLSTNAWTVMFPGRSLAGYVPLRSVRLSGTGVYDAGTYYPHGVKRFVSDGFSQMSFTLMQAVAGSVNTKVVMMRLRQNGPDIEGIVDRACFFSGRYVTGEDVEKLLARNAVSPESGLTADYFVHTPESGYGYGVQNLFMGSIASAAVEFRGTVASTIAIGVSAGVDAKMSSSALSGTLAAPFSGSGSVSLAPASGAGGGSSTDEYENFIAGTKVTVSKNRLLTSLTNVTAEISGSYVSGNYYPAQFCQIRGNNLCITGEVQVATDVWTWRYVTVELTQSQDDVKAVAIDAGWVKKSGVRMDGNVGVRSVYESEFDDCRTTCTPANGPKANPVGAARFSFMYSEPAADRIDVSTSFVNRIGPEPCGADPGFASEDATLRIAGTESARIVVNVPDGATGAFPTNGIVEVAAGGELQLRGGASISGDKSLIRVLAGGKLKVLHSTAISNQQHVHLLGGKLAIRDDLISTYNNSWCYLEHVVLHDGAEISGVPFMIGYTASSASWRVSGSSASSCDASALVKGAAASGTAKTIEFNVVDATDDDEADFIYRGRINANSASEANAIIRKTGGGTFAHLGPIGDAVGLSRPVSIEAGTWLMGGSASPSQDYCMNGGGLSAAGGTENVAGGLVVSRSGTLSVGEGGRLSFADSSAKAWTGGVRVTVVANLAAGALRFGESSSALTSSQLAMMRSNGCRVFLDDAGYLREAAKRGTMVSVK